MFIEIIGRQPLPGDVDRDDIEDALSDVLDQKGEVTGAGSGAGGWNLDVEIFDDADTDLCLQGIANCLVELDLGWVLLRRETWADGRKAEDIAH